MGYQLVDKFAGGVDRSSPRYASAPGTLWDGINGQLTRGGDFEKRKAFESAFTLSPGETFGLARTSAGLYTFGILAEVGLAQPMPVGMSYQQLAHPSSATEPISRIKSWDLYNGKLYVIVLYANGDVRHFYDGANVTDWDDTTPNPVGWGSIVKTFKRKVYSPVGSILWGSGLDTAIDFDTGVSGSFFQNMSTHLSGSDSVTALGQFQNLLAIFSRRVVQLWDMQNDSALNAPQQTINETGTRAARSVIGFGDVDALYLSDSGIRSLRARVGSNAAGVNDVGTPIDSVVRDYIATLDDSEVEDAVAAVEPVDGRFWLKIAERIFVFTYFPSKKISGWSWYEPGLNFTDFVTVNDRIYARAGDTIYLYGGADNNTYDSCRVTAGLPFLSAGKPGTYKDIKGFDIAATGAWNCKLLVDPNDETQYVDVGDITGVTFLEDMAAAVGHTPLIAPVLTHEAPGYASVSQFAIHNDAAETTV